MRELSFKDTLKNDVKAVFLNLAEFGEPHVVNGRKMLAALDDMEHIEREKRMKSNMDGVYARQLLLYVAAEDFGEFPPQGVLLKLDGKQYQVADATNECGVYAITLEANRSR